MTHGRENANVFIIVIIYTVKSTICCMTGKNMWVEHANILEEKSYAQKGIEMKIQMHCFMI
jgi:hypothetical protein